MFCPALKLAGSLEVTPPGARTWPEATRKYGNTEIRLFFLRGTDRVTEELGCVQKTQEPLEWAPGLSIKINNDDHDS